MRMTFRFGALLVFAMTVGLVVGCGDKKAAKDSQKGTSAAKKDEHAHEEEGPHGGHIIDLGNGAFHAELTHDDTTKSVAIYLLDADLKQAVPSDENELTLNLTVDGQPQQYKLPAAPQQGDPAGQSSRYEVKDAKLVDAWDAPNSKGRLRVTIKGESYSGELEAHAHDEHEHKKK